MSRVQRNYGVPAAVLVTILTLALTLSACDWRRETEPVVQPTPDQFVSARNQAAILTAQLVGSLSNKAPAATQDPVIQQLDAAAKYYLTMWGGVYFSEPDAEIDATTPPAWKLALLTARNHHFQLAALYPDHEYGRLALAAAVTYAYAGFADSVGELPHPLRIQLPDFPGNLDDFGPTVPLIPEADSPLVLEYDRVGALYETLAAKHTGTQRLWLQNRSREYQAQAASWEAALELSGTANGRQPLYPLPPEVNESSAAQAALICATEVDFSNYYLALLSSAEPKYWRYLLETSFRHFAVSAIWPECEIADFPLPVLALPDLP